MAEFIAGKIALIIGEGAVASALGSIASSILLSTLAAQLQKQSQNTDRELAYPTSLPAKRFVYGLDQIATGTPAPAWVVQDGVLYCCHILNSRPSDAVSQITLDKRYLDFTGDIYDFTGAGADPVHDKLSGYANFWLGLGDQAGPPDQIMTEVGDATATDQEKFWPTDRWTGCTVLWGRYKKGRSRTMAERWPSAPPSVGAIGSWTKVWDPRDGAQDANDPTTWTVSNNAWLCVLDALRNNPLARWSLGQIDLDSFIAAANDADASRLRLDTTTEPRWRLGGTVGFGGGSVLLDVIAPMVAATGGDLLISGDGITAIPALAQTPVTTVTNWLKGRAMTFKARQKGRDVPKAVQASWPQPEAKWEMQTLTPVVVPGQTWLGGEDRVEPLDLGLVPFAGQAMHLQQIAARRKSMGRELSFLAGPEIFASGAQAGDWLGVDLGADYASRAGTYEIQQTAPGEWLEGADGVAFQQGVTLRETASSIFDWDPATDEQDVYVPDSVAEIDLSLDVPASLDLTTGLTFGSVGDPWIDLEIARSLSDYTSDGATWEWRPLFGGADWLAGGAIDARARLDPGDNQVLSARLTGVAAGEAYEIRARLEAPGRASDWITDSIVAASPSLDLGPPTDGLAIGAGGQIIATFTTPNAADFRAIEFWGSDTDDAQAATLLATTYSGQNQERNHTETGLGPSVTRYYFARSLGPNDAVSAFTSSVSATTDP
ncbi:hypothetical protein [Thalassovita sp.]|uniref:hypothetical protein n=1 Tax=Thalassovita sp. TaxID=1979401 RepID=UPI002881B167|nr:hypothetical protein [Thalassovita sp.]MDF1801731.1 phage tail protein [Thalassovita sp.]